MLELLESHFHAAVNLRWIVSVRNLAWLVLGCLTQCFENHQLVRLTVEEFQLWWVEKCVSSSNSWPLPEHKRQLRLSGQQLSSNHTVPCAFDCEFTSITVQLAELCVTPTHCSLLLKSGQWFHPWSRWCFSKRNGRKCPPEMYIMSDAYVESSQPLNLVQPSKSKAKMMARAAASQWPSIHHASSCCQCPQIDSKSSILYRLLTDSYYSGVPCSCPSPHCHSSMPSPRESKLKILLEESKKQAVQS